MRIPGLPLSLMILSLAGCFEADAPAIQVNGSQQEKRTAEARIEDYISKPWWDMPDADWLNPEIVEDFGLDFKGCVA